MRRTNSKLVLFFKELNYIINSRFNRPFCKRQVYLFLYTNAIQFTCTMAGNNPTYPDIKVLNCFSLDFQIVHHGLNIGCFLSN